MQSKHAFIRDRTRNHSCCSLVCWKHTHDVTFPPLLVALSHTETSFSLLDAFSRFSRSCCREGFLKFESSNRKWVWFLLQSQTTLFPVFSSACHSGHRHFYVLSNLIWRRSSQDGLLTFWRHRQSVLLVLCVILHLFFFFFPLFMHSQIKTINTEKFSVICESKSNNNQPAPTGVMKRHKGTDKNEKTSKQMHVRKCEK